MPTTLRSLTLAVAIGGATLGPLAVAALEPHPPAEQPPATAPAAPDLDLMIEATVDGDRAVAHDTGLTIGRMPEGPDTAAPDLVPLTGPEGVIGYVRSADLLLEMDDPDLEVVALAVYGPDGRTLRGHEIPGQGFVPGREPIETVRPAPVPEGDSPIPGEEPPGP